MIVSALLVCFPSFTNGIYDVFLRVSETEVQNFLDSDLKFEASTWLKGNTTCSELDSR